MKKLAQGFNTTAQDSNLGSRSRESEALPLSHCALHLVFVCSNEHRPTDINVAQMQDVRRCQGDTTDVDVNDTQDDDDVVEPTNQSDESAVGTEWRRASNK